MSLRVRLACGLILITLGGTLFGATGGHAVPTLQKSTGTPLQPTQAKTKYNVLC